MDVRTGKIVDNPHITAQSCYYPHLGAGYPKMGVQVALYAGVRTIPQSIARAAENFFGFFSGGFIIPLLTTIPIAWLTPLKHTVNIP